MVYLGPDSQKIAFVASKFFVASFLGVLDAVRFKEIIPSLEVKISNNPLSQHQYEYIIVFLLKYLK